MGIREQLLKLYSYSRPRIDMSTGFLDHGVQCNGAMVQNGVNLSHVSRSFVGQ